MMERAGWTLIHSLWQEAAIAALLAVAFAALRGSARARYAAACVAMLAMLAAPVATFLLLTPGGSVVAIEPLIAGATPFAVDAFAQSGLAGATGSATAPLAQYLPLVVWLWIAGVAVLSLRLAAGLVVVQRMRSNLSGAARPEWRDSVNRLARQLRVKRAIELVESAAVEVPTVVGWLRPVILLPASAVLQLSPGQIEALLAHEIAHIRRHDYLVNLLQSVVETLLFFHPAVWWVGRSLRTEREHCCDDLAVSVCGDAAGYARALTRLEEVRISTPALAMGADGGSLLGRVRRLLIRNATPAPARTPWLAGLIALTVLCAVWSSSNLLRVSAQIPQPAPAPQARQKPSPLPAPARAPQAPVSAQSEIAAPAPPAAALAPEAPEVEFEFEFEADPEPQAAPAPQAKPDPATPQSGFIASMEAAGMKNLTVDQLVAFKIHGVNADYIRQMNAAGFKADPDQLLGMRIHGVTPQFAQDMTAAGYPGLSIDKLMACKIHNINPKTIVEMKQLGFASLTIDQALAAKIHGLSVEHLRGLKEAGFANLTFDEAVAARIHGATPQFVKSLRDAGFAVSDFDDVLAARIHGVTPDFIAKARQHGFKDLTLQKLIHLKQFKILE